MAQLWLFNQDLTFRGGTRFYFFSVFLKPMSNIMCDKFLTYFIGNPKLFPFFIKAAKAPPLKSKPQMDRIVFTVSTIKANL